MIRFEIPRVPPSPNELRRKYRNPHAYKRLREIWELEVFVNAPKGLPKARPPGPVRRFIPPEGKQVVRIHQRRKRLFDLDNMLYGSMKPVLDALVNVGLILDDSTQHIDLKATQGKCGRLRPSTVIEIEPEGEGDGDKGK